MELTEKLGIKDEGKVAGIISYFTIIGWLIAYFGLHQNKKTTIGSYQLRQTLLLHIVYMVVIFGLPFLLGSIWTSAGIFSLSYFTRLLEFAFFVLWVIGLIGAINSEKKPIPLLGERAQILFSSI
jgi:uncharacterized membrane protein